MEIDDRVDWQQLLTPELADELVRQHRRLSAAEAQWLVGTDRPPKAALQATLSMSRSCCEGGLPRTAATEFDRRLGWQVLGFRSNLWMQLHPQVSHR